MCEAKAHYERDRAVINLTKMNGAGSLAHEFMHGLDHYFGRQDGKAPDNWEVQADGTKVFKTKGTTDYASHGFKYRDSGVREELRAAYKNVMETLSSKAETYVEDTGLADKFVGRARETVAERLDGLRKELSAQKDAKYYKRNNKPASAEQLLEYDTIAKRILDGEALETAFRFDGTTTRLGALKGRTTNDELEKLSAIFKAVRGRSGFNTDRDGVLDRLRTEMGHYDARLKMLASAQSGGEKARKVPTSFAMNAKELDQGRGEDYWTTPHEMAARAFQAYVEDKIKAGGGKSPFLNYAPEGRAIATPWGMKYPFPQGEERQAINKAFDGFVEALKAKETDQGTALYSKESPETGSFGKIYREFKHDANGAIAKLTAEKGGDAIAALHHPEVGDIDLVWGEEGKGESDGFGLAKLVKFHPEIVGNLQETLLTLKKDDKTSTVRRIQLESKDHKAAVRLDWDGKQKAWLLTAFEKKAGDNTRTDTIDIDGRDGTTRPSSSPIKSISQPQGKSSLSTVGEILAQLPSYVGNMLKAGKLEVVQSVEDLPAYLQGKGAALYHAAWHGSPHDHDRFDSSKIGTGEGAQAYGHGLYFSDKKEVAEWYRDKLSNPQYPQVRNVKEKLNEYFKNDSFAQYVHGSLSGLMFQQGISKSKLRADEVLSWAKDEIQGWISEFEAHPRKSSNFGKEHGMSGSEFVGNLKTAKSLLASDMFYEYEKGTSRLYQVELAPQADQYLDWDKPLSGQSDKVKNALIKKYGESYNNFSILNGKKGSDFYQYYLAGSTSIGDSIRCKKS